MRNSFRLALILGAVLSASPALANDRPSTYIAQGVDRAIKEAQRARQEYGKEFGVPQGDFCLLGSWIDEGGSSSYSLKLRGGKDYMFVAAGDKDVTDLDLKVFVQEDDASYDDTTDSKDALVYVEQADGEDRESLTVTVTMNVASTEAEPSFCVLLILEEDGAWASTDNLKHTATILGKECDKLEGFGFDAARNTFCMFGGLMSAETVQGIERDVDAGGYMIVAAGDPNANDVDLYVSAEGEIVCKDEDTDSTPVVAFTSEERARVTLNLSMVSVKKPAFAVAAVLVAQED